MLTKSQLKSKACDSCRQSKLKCSKETPCSRCAKRNKPCNYSYNFKLVCQGPKDMKSASLDFNEDPVKDVNRFNYTPNQTDKRSVMRKNSDSKDSSFTFVQHSGTLDIPVPIITEINAKKMIFKPQNKETPEDKNPTKDAKRMLLSKTKILSTNELIDRFKKLSILNNYNRRMLIEKSGHSIYLGNSPVGFLLMANPSLLSKLPSAYGNFEFPEIPSTTLNSRESNYILPIVINYHFKYVNPFQPLVNHKRFSEELNLRNRDDDFLALYYAVCLSGTYYLPSSFPIMELGKLFGERMYFHIQRSYTKTSLWTLRALILMSQLIAINRNDPSLVAGYRYVGMAHHIAIALGIHIEDEHRQPRLREELRRVWWCILQNDRLYTLCVGRPPIFLDAKASIHLPSAPGMIGDDPDERMEYYGLSERESGEACLYFRSLAHHIIVLWDFNQLRLLKPSCMSRKGSLKVEESIDPKDEYTKLTRKVESHLHDWILKLPCHKNLNFSNFWLNVPNTGNVYCSLLHLYYYSLLIEVNRPLIESDSGVVFDSSVNLHDISLNGISIQRFLRLSPRYKCLIAARFGTTIVANLGSRFGIYGPGYKWWCCLTIASVHISYTNYTTITNPSPASFLERQYNLTIILDALKSYLHSSFVNDIYNTLLSLNQASQ